MRNSCRFCSLGTGYYRFDNYFVVFGGRFPLSNADVVYDDYDVSCDFAWHIEQQQDVNTGDTKTLLCGTDLCDSPIYELKINFCPICGRYIETEDPNDYPDD